MKKYMRVLSKIALLTLCMCVAVFFSSCQKENTEPLDEEVADIRIDMENMYCSWKAIDGVTEYDVVVSGEDYLEKFKVEETKFDLINIYDSGSYTIKIKGKVEDKTSTFYKIDYDFESNDCFEYTLQKNNTYSATAKAYKAVGTVAIPIKYKGVKISNVYFNNCPDLTFIIIPTKIDSVMATNCPSLKRVNLPSNIDGLWSFKNCTSLEEAILPNNIDRIPSNAFCGCKSLKKIVYSPSLTSIDAMAFYECKSLKSFHLSADLKSFSNSAFACSGIEELTVDEGERYKMDSGCLIDKNYNSIVFGLPDAIIPSYIEQIGVFAFMGSKIKAISLPDSVQTIGVDSFKSSSLEEINFNSATPNIDATAFNECFCLNKILINPDNEKYELREGCLIRKSDNALCLASMKTTTIPAGIEIIEKYVFYNRTDITTIVIPSSVNLIEQYAFYGCQNLKEVKIPVDSQLKRILGYAFYDTGIKSFIMPKTVESIGSDVFANCTIYASQLYSLDNWSIHPSSNSSWDSLSCTVFYGCEFEEENGYYYVKSLRNGSPQYNAGAVLVGGDFYKKDNQISPPGREGYNFAGWRPENQGIRYTSVELISKVWNFNVLTQHENLEISHKMLYCLLPNFTNPYDVSPQIFYADWQKI